MARDFAADISRVREFVLKAAAAKKPHLAKLVQDRFEVSRPTAHNYLRRFLEEGLIVRFGTGRYDIARETHEIVRQVAGLEEHEVWAKEIAPRLKGLPGNVVEIWEYGCTEMINNVIDHSGSEGLLVRIERTPIVTDISIHDSGVGIFRKIATALNLEDERHAVLELSKGKVTTDPDNHTGEGIFFTSRTVDDFDILSGGVFYNHEMEDDEDWILGNETPTKNVEGTHIHMGLRNNSERCLRDVFDAYATDTEDYRFDKTVVPVKLLQYGDDRLVSRSQAKRLMNRFDRFKTVVLNFDQVESIGQAFADEVFRVFAGRHPDVEIIPINTNEQVARMIARAGAD